ncbi:hypothetical protein SteCoe_28018 [Stentor coeruleus]|uniref:DUF4201 domain-containing protein n=1 Tax=Stentor coeruleus TaxID=5963 RepID=A0A1R2B964_9CILI|nr:hypothetical protein SteCoe_28018 [Stentor coeruleus]
MKKNDFLPMIDAAIKYFDPINPDKESMRRFLELPNETAKLELEKLNKSILDTTTRIKDLKYEKKQLAGSIAFNAHEILELEKDNLDKQVRIKELKDHYEIRKKYLDEIGLELDTNRRIEVYKEIAEKRLANTVSVKVNNNSQYNLQVRKSSDLLEQVEKAEDDVEKALICMHKLNEEVKKKKEYIKTMQFRLGIENREHEKLSIHNQKLNQDLDMKNTPTPPPPTPPLPAIPLFKRPLTAISRGKSLGKLK